LNKPDSLFIFHVDIVHGCQLQCVGCPNSTIMDKVKRMDVNDFSTILGNVDVEEIHTLRLYNFGEPLLHRNLDKIVAEIPKQKWKASIVEISTNGQKVYWDNFEEMLKLQVVNKIAVSCDGDGSAEKYESLRPPAKMDKLMYFLNKTRELRDRWSPATQLVTRTIIETEQDKENWRQLLQPLGWESEFRQWMILPEAVANPSQRTPEKVDGICVFLAKPDEFTGKTWHGDINLLYVDHDGTFVPCCYHPRAGVFGNLLHQKYSEVLAGEKRAAFLAKMARDRKSMKVCSQCELGPIGNEGPTFLASLDALG
jgi:radical SAM protein with 4Fe4S-binding SPASM domain